MKQTKRGFASRGTAVALSIALTAGTVPAIAFAESAGEGAVILAPAALDKMNLANGTYTVSVSARQASNVAQPSTMGGALSSNALLTVKDGVYSLSIHMESATVGTTTAYVNEIAYYPSFSVNGSAVSGQGDPTVLWTAPTDEGAPADAVVPLNETGKSMGYALIRVGVKMMGSFKPDAVVVIDWDSLAIKQLDDPPKPEVNHDALNAAIASAQVLEQGKKSDEAFAALQKAISEAQMALAEGVPQSAVDAAVTRLQQAIETFKNSPDTNAVSKYALGKALEECRALVAQGGVSPEKAQALQAAIDAAQEVYDRDSATQDEVNAQVNALALAKSEFNSYTAPIGFADTSGNDLSGHMSAFVSPTVKVSPVEGGTFDLVVTVKAAASVVPSFTYGENATPAVQVGTDGSSRLFKMNVASIDDPILVTWEVNASGGPHRTADTGALSLEPLSAQKTYLVVNPASAESRAALDQAIVDAKSRVQGKKTDEAFAALQRAIAAAEEVQARRALANQGSVTKATVELETAVRLFNASADKPEAPQPETPKPENPNPENPQVKQDFEVGHVYAVPLQFTRSGTNALSMADQYFGDTAYVRPLANGMFDVRFSTNRPDYALGLTYDGGTQADITSDSADNREFRIFVAKSKANIIVPVSMSIKPMLDMGGGPVSADMHLYLSEASDQGVDGGQVAGAAKTGNTPKSGGATGATAQTGDSLPAAATGAVALASAAVAALASRFGRRRAENQ